jgi:hypothetical protein
MATFDRKAPPAWRYVGVYLVTREYGGPEEGGWWYDEFQHVASYKLWRPIRPVLVSSHWKGHTRSYEHCPTDQQYRFRDSVEERFNHMTYLPGGSLGSVLGGEEVRTFFEESAGEHQSQGRPHYE